LTVKEQVKEGSNYDDVGAEIPYCCGGRNGGKGKYSAYMGN